MTIDGKVVAITGASSGIGLAAAALLAERGAKLMLGARGADKLDGIAGRLSVSGADVFAKATDVSRRADVAELVSAATETYGQLGVLFGIAAALPVSRRQGFGHFVNTASTAAFRVTPGQSVYAGTKMAVRAISEGLRQEAGEKLRVTVISRDL